MTAPSDIVTLVVRAHEVVIRVMTDTGGFLQDYGVATASIEVAAALGVVFVVWVIAAIVIGGFIRTMWIVTKRIIDHGGETAEGPKPDRMQ